MWNGWRTRYLETRIDAVETLATERARATAEAIKIFNDSFKERMDQTNEWRGTVEDQQAHFVSRDSYDALEARMRLSETFRSNIEGRLATIGGLVFLVNLVITIVGIVLAHVLH